MKSTQVFPMLLLSCCPFTLSNPLHQRQVGKSMVYSFDSVSHSRDKPPASQRAYQNAQLEATADLDWTPCFNSFTCTKLQVPLDYENESAGTTHVSFIKWTAVSNSTIANSTVQDILFNPGGPGESGISYVRLFLPELQATLGFANNIIGFDPRGVDNSGPDLSCFPDRKPGRSTLYSDLTTPLDANDTKSYSEIFARSATFGDFCTNTHSRSNDAARYVNTVATANDMRYFTELLAKSKGQAPQMSQLWYYGVSYGSVLGMTFASLFPGRVGRVVVDGVVDGEYYYQGNFAHNVYDADKAFRYFFQTCYDAGKNGACNFWAESPIAIEARFNSIIADLAVNPVPVVSNIPAIGTLSDLKSFIARVVYSPIGLFELLAEILVELEGRNASFLASFSHLGESSSGCTPEVATGADYEPSQFIACTDANGRFNLSTFNKWVDYANSVVKQSRFLGEVWAPARSVQCRKLDIKAPRSQVFEGYPSANQTSNPLLFISTAIDPVTPLRAAEKMVKRFGGAGLLVQDSVGHSSFSAPSECTSKVVETYFKTGKVPKKDAHCKADQVPFQDGAVVRNSTSMELIKKRSFLST